MSQDLQNVIDLAWESRATLTAINSPEVRDAVEQVIGELNAGRLRVAERQGVGQWHVNQWVKKVGSSRVDLQACKLEYSIVSPK